MKDGPLQLLSNSGLAGDGVGVFRTGSGAVLNFDSGVGRAGRRLGLR
jgi:hypothetical protein